MKTRESRSGKFMLVVLTFFAVVAPLTVGLWVAQQPSYTGTAFAESVFVSRGRPHVLLLNFSLSVMEVKGAIYSKPVAVTYMILDANHTRLQPPMYGGRVVFKVEGKTLHEIDWKPNHPSVYFLVISSEEEAEVFYWISFLAPYFFGQTQQVALGLWLTSATSACIVSYLAPRRRLHHWHVGVIMIAYSLAFLALSAYYELLSPTSPITYVRTGGVYTLLCILLLLVGVMVLLSDIEDLLIFTRGRGARKG